MERPSGVDVTTIDILSDSVVDICDKLFYQATNGKTIDLAWEAPQPISVNPLTSQEVDEWGESAMKVSVARVTNRPERLGSRVVSANSRFAQRSSANPFYGYKSDPVVAASFQRVEPIGPIAKALKAAGELASLAHRNGEDEEPVWNLVKCGFGIDVSKYKKILKPDLGSSSRADEVKLIRSPNHMLYGFNSNAPTVGTDSGKYRSETMDTTLLFDWHSMHLTMRFIGESMVKYSRVGKPVNTIIHFAPAYQEGRFNPRNTYADNIISPESSVVPECLKPSIISTMRYLEGSSDRLDANYGIRSMARSLNVDTTTPVNIEHIRELANRSSATSFQLPTNVARFNKERAVGEVSDRVNRTFFKTVVSGALKTNLQTVPGWRRILVMLIGTFFANERNMSAKLSLIARKKKTLAALNPSETEELRLNIADAFPSGTGFLFYVLLERLSPSKTKAISEFCMMIAAVSGLEVTPINTTYDEAFTNAIIHSADPNTILSVIQSAYLSHSAGTHGVSQIMRKISGSPDIVTAYGVAIRDYMYGRQKYWSSFYLSMVHQCQENLISLKGIASDRGIKKITSRYEGTRHIELLEPGLYSSLSNEDLIAEIAKNKTKSVLSSFSSLAYQYATITIDNVFHVTVELKAHALQGIIRRQADDYARKRQSWGKKLATAGDEWPSKIGAFSLLTRKADMCGFVDEHFDPNIKWKQMLTDTERKFAVTQKSVQRMLQNNLAMDSSIVESVESMEEKDIENLDTNAMSNNKYALLVDSESEDDDSVNTIPDLLNINREATVCDKPGFDLSNPTLPVLSSYSRVMGKAPGAPAKTPTATANLAAMFSKPTMSTAPIVVLNVDDLSLRDKLKYSYFGQYNDEAYLAFLKKTGVGGTDFRGTQNEVDEACVNYLSFYGNKGAKFYKVPGRFMTNNPEEFDIM